MNPLLLFFIHFGILIFIIGYILVAVNAIGTMDTPASRRRANHQNMLYDIAEAERRAGVAPTIDRSNPDEW